MKDKILWICPSRKRPDRLERLIKSWKDYKQRVNKNSVGPSYIPNSTFALALISVIIEKNSLPHDSLYFSIIIRRC
jgi:hypothetical protein